MSIPELNAEALYQQLRRSLQPHIQPTTRLLGIASGGAWLAQRLQRELAPNEPLGIISSALHRDDYASRGMAASAQTKIPFKVDKAHILLLDDVLFTGRTIRAVINELFDFGRPASIKLAVLVDRGGRELPIAPDWHAARISLAADQSLRLLQEDDGSFSFKRR